MRNLHKDDISKGEDLLGKHDTYRTLVLDST